MARRWVLAANADHRLVRRFRVSFALVFVFTAVRTALLLRALLHTKFFLGRSEKRVLELCVPKHLQRPTPAPSATAACEVDAAACVYSRFTIGGGGIMNARCAGLQARLSPLPCTL